MQVIVNGFRESVPEGSSIGDVITSFQEYEIHMIVELNHRFIPQNAFDRIQLQEGDILELIHPAFGG
jgi:thiamine biosynthesis protein ThiS